MAAIADKILTHVPQWVRRPQLGNTLQRAMNRSPALQNIIVNIAAAIGYCAVFGIPMLSLLLAGYLASALSAPEVHWHQPSMLVFTALTITLAWATLELALLRPELPAGIPLTKNDAHRLFGLIERRTARFGAPEIHEVRLTRDCEVRVVRTPGSGFLVNHRNTLCIGLPLLHMLSYDQFRVELRAAIGHFAATRDPNQGEIATLRDSWDSYASYFSERRSPGAWLLRGFIALYQPFFAQLSHQVAQDHALSRDQYITEVIPDMETLKLIANKTVGEHFMAQRFWPMVFSMADRNPTPSVRPFSNFEPMLQRLLEKPDAERWLLKAMTRTPDANSATPTLAERLGMIGYNQLHFIELPQQAAVTRLLGRHHTRLAKAVDFEWRRAILPEWKQRHQAYQDEKQRFENLHKKFEQQKLEGPAAVKYASLARRHLPPEDAVLVLQQLLDQNSANAEAVFKIGQKLLELDHPDGLRALEHAMDIDKAYVNKASPLLSAYALKHKKRQNRATKRLYKNPKPASHVA